MDFWVQGQSQKRSDSQGCCWASGCCRAWGQSGMMLQNAISNLCRQLWSHSTQQCHSSWLCLQLNTQGQPKEPWKELYSPDQEISRLLNSQGYILFKVMNSLTKCVYKLLPNIQHISNIKDSSREFSNKKITSSATIFRRNYLQTKFLRTLEYSH